MAFPWSGRESVIALWDEDRVMSVNRFSHRGNHRLVGQFQ